MRREGEEWTFYRGGYPGRPRGGGDRAFFFRDLIANLKKKLHLRPVALWGATGVFLKYFKTDIYF